MTNSTARARFRPGTFEDHVARSQQADVDRAVETFVDNDGWTRGTVRWLRAKMDSLMRELAPGHAGAAYRWFGWTGFPALARAADVALDELLSGLSGEYGSGSIGIQWAQEQQARVHLAEVLDEAYCVLYPHAAAERRRATMQLFRSARRVQGRK